MKPYRWTSRLGTAVGAAAFAAWVLRHRKLAGRIAVVVVPGDDGHELSRTEAARAATAAPAETDA